MSQHGTGAKVNDYLRSSVGVVISLVLIPASQLGIRGKVNDYLGSSVGVVISLVLIPASQLGISVRPEKFQILEKGQNSNFGYKNCNFG